MTAPQPLPLSPPASKPGKLVPTPAVPATFSQAAPAPLPAVRGWCPGTMRPMLSGDGYVLRVRPAEGRLSVAQALGLADLAAEHGNETLQLTTRANLQIRGLREPAIEPVQAGLLALGLADPSLTPQQDGRLNIIISPFPLDGKGLHVADAPAIWRGLRDALVADDAPDLPSKFGFAIDVGGHHRHISDVSADVRIEAAAQTLTVRADGAALARPVADTAEAVAVALDIARWFMTSGGAGTDGRGRMRDHLARGAELPPELAGSLVPADRARFDRYGRWPHGAWSVGLSQGQADCATFRQLARAASGALRITPWRSLVLPAGSTIAGLKDTGRFILDGADPRARVFTCTGAPGCAQARGRTRLLGERIAPYLPPGKTAHVSGCAKGCARSGSADLTVVMQPDGLVGVGYGCRADAPDLHIRPGPKDRDGEPAFLQEITDALHV